MLLNLTCAGARAERFTLNPTTGELRAASPLRWLERTDYAFTVTAADHGTPGLSSTCRIQIQVTHTSGAVAIQPPLSPLTFLQHPLLTTAQRSEELEKGGKYEMEGCG